MSAKLWLDTLLYLQNWMRSTCKTLPGKTVESYRPNFVNGRERWEATTTLQDIPRYTDILNN